ncbi:MAG: SMC-Scp complex subunit ScpB [Thermodesulfobacteriota bacterium]|nr:SMC-Scp complex subunit ScpB [Thermodesulfobacteriota bacterium]
MTAREIIESIVFSSDRAVPEKELIRVMPEKSAQNIRDMVDDLNKIYASTNRSFYIERAAMGYVFVSKEEYTPYIAMMQPRKRLSTAALEVMALVAYQGPCTKKAIDGMRGVDSTSSLKGLLKMGLIDIRAGRPAMTYYATNRFLETFGLDSFADLPDMDQFSEVFMDDPEEREK